MRDEIDSRLWAAHGQQFSADLQRGIVAIGEVLARLWSAATQFRHAPPAIRSRAGQA